MKQKQTYKQTKIRGGGQHGGGQIGSQRGGGGKRQATTPVGGVYKDLRRNINSNEMDYYEEEEWTEVRHNKPQSPPREQT